MANEVKEKLEAVEQKVTDFSELIDKISSAPPEMKTLWTEIYENALEDRTSAQLLFVDLSQNVFGDQHGHMNHGKLLTTYLERMNKANDQLTKLAELIEKAAEREDQIDGEDLYSGDEFND